MKEEPLNFLSILQKKEKDTNFHFLQIDGLFTHDEKRETMRFSTLIIPAPTLVAFTWVANALGASP